MNIYGVAAAAYAAGAIGCRGFAKPGSGQRKGQFKLTEPGRTAQQPGMASLK